MSKSCQNCGVSMLGAPAWKKLCLVCWKLEKKIGRPLPVEPYDTGEDRALAEMEEGIVLAENNFERDSDFRKRAGLYHEGYD